MEKNQLLIVSYVHYRFNGEPFVESFVVQHRGHLIGQEVIYHGHCGHDLGILPPGPGLWVWQAPADYDRDVDGTPLGEFRFATEEEAITFSKGENIFAQHHRVTVSDKMRVAER